MGAQVPDLPVVEFETAKSWEAWLREHHATSDGVWLKIAKQGTGVTTVTMPEVIDVALCWGWIDGLRHKHDDVYFRQRMTPAEVAQPLVADQPRQGRGAHRRGPHAAARGARGRGGESRRPVGRRLRGRPHHRGARRPHPCAAPQRRGAARVRAASTARTATRSCTGSTTPSAPTPAPVASSSSSRCSPTAAPSTDAADQGEPTDDRQPALEDR